MDRRAQSLRGYQHDRVLRGGSEVDQLVSESGELAAVVQGNRQEVRVRDLRMTAQVTDGRCLPRTTKIVEKPENYPCAGH